MKLKIEPNLNNIIIFLHFLLQDFPSEWAKEWVSGEWHLHGRRLRLEILLEFLKHYNKKLRLTYYTCNWLIKILIVPTWWMVIGKDFAWLCAWSWLFFTGKKQKLFWALFVTTQAVGFVGLNIAKTSLNYKSSTVIMG